MQSSTCCSDDRKCSKSLLAPTDVDTRYGGEAISRIRVVFQQ